MKTFLKFDYALLTQAVLQEKLEALGISFDIVSFGEVNFRENLSESQIIEIKQLLQQYGITVIENQKSVLVQKIKDAISEMVFNEEQLQVKASVYLSEKLQHSYGYLSNLFSDVTYTSIENYIIIQKIEFAKQLMLQSQLTLTEIAFRLNYSSVAHLSNQFKNTTGISPTVFQRIIAKRKQNKL